jgi:hypothetical protein
MARAQNTGDQTHELSSTKELDRSLGLLIADRQVVFAVAGRHLNANKRRIDAYTKINFMTVYGNDHAGGGSQSAVLLKTFQSGFNLVKGAALYLASE